MGIPKLVACDIDGTLVGEPPVDGIDEPSSYTIEVLESMAAAGSIICVATGRAKCDAVSFASHFPSMRYVIPSDGEEIWQFTDLGKATTPLKPGERTVELVQQAEGGAQLSKSAAAAIIRAVREVDPHSGFMTQGRISSDVPPLPEAVRLV